MKAFVVAQYGKDGIRAADVPEPTVGNSDVLVRVSAASINPLDKMVRNGEFKQLLKYKAPFVVGHDVAGVVTEVGARVRDFKAGDEVYARPRDLRIGTFAEYIAIDQNDVALKPASLSLHEAAAVPLVAQAATTASGASEQLVRDLGADVVVDYTKQDFSQILSGYDLVLDSLGGENLMKSLTVLKPGGLAIGVAGPPDAGFAKQLGAPKPFELVMSFLSRKVRRGARKLGVRYSFFFMRASGAQLGELGALDDAGHLRPVLDSTFAFDQTLEALAYVESGKVKAGKVVVTLD